MGPPGLNYWRVKDGDNAERCLLSAREKSADVRESASILGDIHEARKDPAGAAGHYREAARREPARAELWLKLADASEAANREADSVSAVEEALKLEPDLWTRRIGLVGALPGGERRKRRAAAPRDGATAAARRWRDDGQVRGLLGKAGRASAEALALWRRTMELDPKNETGYFSVARLLGEAGEWGKRRSKRPRRE